MSQPRAGAERSDAEMMPDRSIEITPIGQFFDLVQMRHRNLVHQKPPVVVSYFRPTVAETERSLRNARGLVGRSGDAELISFGIKHHDIAQCSP
jgi:hypothetical protein